MRLEKFRQLSPAEQKKEVQEAVKKIAETQKMLEEKGVFTFYNPKKTGGLVMEYIPHNPIPVGEIDSNPRV